jgi:hypothetical protein
MHAGNEVELARQPHVLARHLPGRIVRSEDRKPEADEAVIAGEPALPQALDLGARHGNFAEMLLARPRIGLRRAVEKDRANAGLVETVDRRVGVVRSRIVVAPVDQRGRAAMDLVERAHQVGDEDVFRAEQRGEPAVHRLHVTGNRPIGGHPAQRALPGVHMGVDQARHHDHVGGVDDLRAVGRRQLRRHGGNVIVLDQHIAAGEIGNSRIHRNDRAALDQDPAHEMPPSVFVVLSVLMVR